jgi:hypothetical protein
MTNSLWHYLSPLYSVVNVLLSSPKANAASIHACAQCLHQLATARSAPSRFDKASNSIRIGVLLGTQESARHPRRPHHSVLISVALLKQTAVELYGKCDARTFADSVRAGLSPTVFDAPAAKSPRVSCPPVFDIV